MENVFINEFLFVRKLDDDVTKKPGIIPYLLSDRTKMTKNISLSVHLRRHRNSGLTKDKDISARSARKMELIQHTLSRKCRVIISFRGARAEERWTIICRCYAGLIIIVRGICKMIRKTAQMSGLLFVN